MDEERLPRKLLHGKMEGRRRRGRPRKAKEEVVTGLGGGPEGYAGWKVVGEVQSKEEWRPKPTPGCNAEEKGGTSALKG
jgi:hypothetical protein